LTVKLSEKKVSV